MPHQKALNVDSATDEIPWNDPILISRRSKVEMKVLGSGHT